MKDQIKLAEELIDYIHQSPSSYHVIENSRTMLDESGFAYLDLTKSWQIKPGGKYYTIKNNSALFAFSIGTDNIQEKGMKFICAHSDSPGFKIKPQPEIISDNKFMSLNTEVYGGPILMSWLDRPLSIAGRVLLKSDDVLSPEVRLINFDKPMVVIPSLAIHLNRTVNDGIKLSKQKDMLPLIATVTESLEKDNYLITLIAEKLNVDSERILDFDLFLSAYEKGCILGANNEFISAPKLDDLAMVHAGLKALIAANNVQSTNFMCVFDNEEVGSQTKQGAGSPVLRHIIERIAEKLGKNNEELQRAIYHSFMISADMAHSVHPNHLEKHDPIIHPVINGGPAIKVHANQKYTTDAESSAIFESICQKANIPYQKFVNHSDMPGGSTLGNVSTSQIDIRTVDVGNPMLSMHSIRELSGVKDHSYALKAYETFYNL